MDHKFVRKLPILHVFVDRAKNQLVLERAKALLAWLFELLKFIFFLVIDCLRIINYFLGQRLHLLIILILCILLVIVAFDVAGHMRLSRRVITLIRKVLFLICRVMTGCPDVSILKAWRSKVLPLSHAHLQAVPPILKSRFSAR